jgi:hypothetical protein
LESARCTASCVECCRAHLILKLNAGCGGGGREWQRMRRATALFTAKNGLVLCTVILHLIFG